MPIKGFSYDTLQDLYIADGFAGSDWADGSEAYLLSVFEGLDAISDYPVELAGFIRDWPSRYHLSHLRVNFLEALRPLLRESWKALELGGGTGVITKWLAQAVAEVDVVEGALERARVNRVRTRDESNVRHFVGDIVDAPYPSRYDLITLVGVLEYTPARPGGTRREASLELLRKIRGSLKDGGVLMVAIENRLGAKYWAGCREDHSNGLFDGIMGYPDDTPITFSRNELETLLSRAGFEHRQFYHLHPDYKLPTIVIRETDFPKEVSLHQWTMGFAEDYVKPRKHFIPDPLLMKSVEDAGLLWHFSNSFLVLCSPSPETRLAEDWLVKKFSNSSRPELHHTITLLEREGSLRVERAPMREGRSPADLGEYTFTLSDGEYVPGSLLSMEAHKALMSSEWFDRLTLLCQELLDLGRASLPAKPTPQHGPFEMLDGTALDLTFWNVIRRDDDTLVFFDRKWTCVRPVPADYVIFRSLLWLPWAAAPLLKADMRETIISLLVKLWPAFDDARLDSHLREEEHLQKCVHAGLPSQLPVDYEGHLVIPRGGKFSSAETSLPTEIRQRLDHSEDPAELLAEIFASTSWRLTKPVRMAGSAVRQVGQTMRRLIRHPAE